MAKTTRLNYCIHVIMVGSVLLLFSPIKAQTKIDSMVIAYLVKNNQIKESDVVFKKIIKTGKRTSTVVSNVYNKEVFCMANENEVLRVYGFGTHSSHSYPCMLFDYTIANNHNYTYLGLGRVDEELVLLSSIFTFGGRKLADHYQLEILEIYLGYRQGKYEVPVFLHCQQ